MADWEDIGDWEDMDAPGDVVGAEGGGEGGVDEDDEDLGPEEPEKAGAASSAAAKSTTGVAVVLGSGEADPGSANRTKKIQKQRAREARERREAEAIAARKRMAEDTPLDDPVAEKARLARLVEEADHEITDELFAAPAPPSAGGSSGAAGGAGGGAVEVREATIEDVLKKAVLKTPEDHKALAEAIGARVVRGGKPKSKMILQFLQELVRAVSAPLAAEDITSLNKTTNAIKNEKIKALKGKQKKKKFVGKQGYANVQSEGDWMGGDGRADAFDDMDDFM